MTDVNDAASDPAPEDAVDALHCKPESGVIAGGDDIDAKTWKDSGVTKYARHYFRGMETDTDDQFAYNMNHPKRGLFVIINNKNFHPRTKMNDRSGTDADAAGLYQRFKAMEFDVRMAHNQTVRQMMDIMLDASKYNHCDADCFACAILSHGDEGVVYGTDDIINVDTLIAPLKGDRCKTLVGKPKIFIIQACRGSELDHGVEVSDAETETVVDRKVYRIPTEADILYCYSTVPGYFSWRNSTRGSWFVQALCKMLEEYGKSRDFLWIMTRVAHMVAYEFESNASKEFMNKKKQVPQVVSMLTKDLYFASKGTPV